MKFNKLKYGSETVPLEDQKSSSHDGQPGFDDGKIFLFFFIPFEIRSVSDDNKDDSNLAFGGSSVSFKQGRQLLRQYEFYYLSIKSSFLFLIRYLKEIGYVDTIIDIRSTAVKKLLGIKSETNFNGNNSTNGDIKPTNESKKYTFE